MSYILLGIILLAIWHFIYENILAPSLRLHLRNELFALRDELRKLHMQGVITSPEDVKVFNFIHNNINIFLKTLSELSLVTYIHVKKYLEANESYTKSLQERLKLIESSKNKEMLSIFKNGCFIAHKAFLINSGGWAIYIFPIFICWLFYKRLQEVITKLFVTPSQILERSLQES